MISRYDGIGHYDWVAIPLIPYLYAVDQTEDVPLFVDAKWSVFCVINTAASISRRSRLIQRTEQPRAETGMNWWAGT